MKFKFKEYIILGYQRQQGENGELLQERLLNKLDSRKGG
jgi:hypothetical protein